MGLLQVHLLFRRYWVQHWLLPPKGLVVAGALVVAPKGLGAEGLVVVPNGLGMFEGPKPLIVGASPGVVANGLGAIAFVPKGVVTGALAVLLKGPAVGTLVVLPMGLCAEAFVAVPKGLGAGPFAVAKGSDTAEIAVFRKGLGDCALIAVPNGLGAEAALFDVQKGFVPGAVFFIPLNEVCSTGTLPDWQDSDATCDGVPT